MRLIKDTFFIKADKDLNKYLSLKGLEGQPLIIDTDLEKFTHSCKIGVLSHVPLEIDQQFSGGCVLKKGDTILFHHHVVQDCNKVSIDEQELYRAEFFQIFAKVENDRIIPVENFIFVEPILEPEENLWHGMFAMKPHREFLKTCAKVCFVGTVASDYGIVENDVVYFTKNADYEIKVGDKLYWRMRVRNVMAIERNGDLVCFRDKMIVKPIPFKEQMFSIGDDKRRDYFGEVLSVGSQVAGINVGDKINYCHGVATKLNYKGEDLSFLALSNINYVL
jgi:co-chaperonin GroES (HSP10)